MSNTQNKNIVFCSFTLFRNTPLERSCRNHIVPNADGFCWRREHNTDAQALQDTHNQELILSGAGVPNIPYLPVLQDINIRIDYNKYQSAAEEEEVEFLTDEMEKIDMLKNILNNAKMRNSGAWNNILDSKQGNYTFDQQIKQKKSCPLVLVIAAVDKALGELMKYGGDTSTSPAMEETVRDICNAIHHSAHNIITSRSY